MSGVDGAADPAPDAPGAAPAEVTPTQPDFDVVVVGGGVAGLVAARECAKRRLSVAVFEASEAVGGCVGRITLGDLTLDSGAEGFATRNGSVAVLLDELGLGDDIVEPNPAGAWLIWGGSNGVDAAPLPTTSVVGIPANPLAADVRRILGWPGALRAYLDRVRPYLKIGRAESLGDLVRERMGRAVLDRLVTPIASGVYSADATLLEVDRVAPGLNAELTRLGSLSAAVTALVAERKAGSAVLGLRGGMHRLVDALRADAERLGVVVHTGSPVRSLSATDEADAADAASGASIRLDVGDDASITAAHVVFACSATATQALAAGVVPNLPAPMQPAGQAVELITLVLHTGVLDDAPRGTGALVAEGAPGVAAKALTHSSAKWSWLAEPGRAVLRLSYGRAGHPNPLDGLDDAAATALAVQDLNAILGVGLSTTDVHAFARTRWQDAASHATLGQAARVRAFERAVSDASNISVTGSWIAGTGLASVVPHAIQVAAQAVQAVLMPKTA
ncbi:MAG TPA: protoporphyrinogen oxidase [Candidatus Lumbricidophila sp.]|nr:protoporphyrinogen oxidase [Candidatus Lumbricidophila sp.]